MELLGPAPTCPAPAATRGPSHGSASFQPKPTFSFIKKLTETPLAAARLFCWGLCPSPSYPCPCPRGTQRWGVHSGLWWGAAQVGAASSPAPLAESGVGVAAGGMHVWGGRSELCGEGVFPGGPGPWGQESRGSHPPAPTGGAGLNTPWHTAKLKGVWLGGSRAQGLLPRTPRCPCS